MVYLNLGTTYYSDLRFIQKVQHRKVQCIAQGHTASEWKSQDWLASNHHAISCVAQCLTHVLHSCLLV